jgi:hypothetical protein
MMTRAEYDRYAEAFNSLDYETVCDFYAEDAELAFFGVRLRGREEVKRFYAFLHAHVKETLTIHRYASSDELVALEGVIRIEAASTITNDMLDERGIPHVFAIEKGQIVEMPQYIHYHLNADGLFTGVGCALV